MFSLIQTAHNLALAGKLHKRLVIQLFILSIVSLVLLGVVGYEIFKYGLNIWVSLGLASAGFLFGLFVFSKMSKPIWDEKKEIIITARMDVVAILILLAYIGIELGLRAYLQAHYAGTVEGTGYLLAAVGGSLLGRSLGTLIALQKLVNSEQG